ncbi:PadR family transcriptional regulator [Alkalihalobacillus clausii]|nr:PadR family transcriptional regulator [Shouchella clausii]MCM3550487.1 PadR family transcriptional regulator [Shouchella clausii]MCR1290227.1 PadR family transcriptional regulator [Shouchella clausii]PAF13179.1 PadR family transcriptional regulator [Shouchella clausii]QNM45593.1 PadR family transcriptional regulator [Shouchella clausii]
MDNLSLMLKGVLQGMILQLIEHKEMYGYEITRKLNQLGFTGIVEGTVYTVLVRLEKNKLVDVVKKPSDMGPPRKFYTLNDKGKEELMRFWEKWAFLSERIEQIRNEGEE